MSEHPRRTDEPPRGLRALLPGIAVALVFLLVGLAVLDDFGMTWDENESYRAGLQNLENLSLLARGGTGFEWPWHELLGYQFLFDTVRAGFALAAGSLVGGPVLIDPGLAPVPIPAFHLFHLLLSAATLLLTYLAALELSGRVRVGVLSAAALATMPKLVGHSQNNPKDVIGLFVFSFALWAVARATRAAREGGGRAPFAWAGAALGLAFASHVLAALLVPIAAAWVLWRHPGHVRRRIAALALCLATAGAVAFFLWPWLWPDPIVRTARILRRIATYRVELEVLYLGRIYPWADPPWHYFLASLLAATPVALTLTALFGAVEAVRSRVASASREARGRVEAARFALLWFAIPVAIEAFAGARYDGVRHLLVVLPALAMLAGLGLDRLLELAGRHPPAPSRTRAAARIALGLAAAAWAWTVVDLVRYHPYQDAYLNLPLRAALGPSAPEHFELEYWGATFKEGASWLNEHARPGARVLVPVAPQCAAPYLDPELVLVAPDPPTERAEADFLMVMTRRAIDTPQIAEVRALGGPPAFRVERMGATLMEVYRLDGSGAGTTAGSRAFR